MQVKYSASRQNGTSFPPFMGEKIWGQKRKLKMANF